MPTMSASRIILVVVVLASLAVTASASAGGRFTGWASTSTIAADGTAVDAPSHSLSICSGVGLNFSDSDQEHTTYRVAVTNPRGKVMAWRRTTSNWGTTSTVRPRTAVQWRFWILGRYVARWYVSGNLTSSWRFQMRSCE